MDIADLTLPQLLKTRLCDLPLKYQGSWVEECADIVQSELDQRQINLKLYFWISNEWFVADGSYGIAVPFYLFHPRLIELEKKYFGKAEGATRLEAIKLIRHEAGHAVDNAFKLRNYKQRRLIFGDSKIKYPDSYKPNIFSKNYVRHLNDGYAQSHPDEDWAETFAVWLADRNDWQKRYFKWPAMEKLCLMDYLMGKILDSDPLLKNKKKFEKVSDEQMTYGEYIEQKTSYLGLNKKIFAPSIKKLVLNRTMRNRRQFKLDDILKNDRKFIVEKVLRNTNQKKYVINRMFNHLKKECKNQNLLMLNLGNNSKRDIINLMSRKTNLYIKDQHKIKM